MLAETQASSGDTNDANETATLGAGGQGKLKEAIADYSRIIAIDPNHISAHVNRGTALTQIGAYDEALADFNAALRIEKNDPGIHRGRGSLFERKGLIDRARADYRRALELAPDDRWVQDALRRLPAN